MGYISEEWIKRIALRKLKSYYRFRPRAEKGGESRVRTDLSTEEGIIADGYLSFLKADNTQFVATLEVTSLNTRNEVLFQKQRKLLTWDSLTLSLIVVAFVVALSHIYEWLVFHEFGMLRSLLLSIGLIGTFFLIFRAAFQGARRYRYIYAIEQFKQYYADDQWIAVGEDVFSQEKVEGEDEDSKAVKKSRREDKYFLELKDQCINNGFGLLLIAGEEQEGKVRVIATPARAVVGSKNREVVDFEPVGDIRRMLPRAKPPRFLKEAGRYLPTPRVKIKKPARPSLQRYRKTYFHQMVSSGIALILLGAIYYRESQFSPVIYVDEATYGREVLARNTPERLEPLGYVIDSNFIRPFRENTVPYLNARFGQPPVQIRSRVAAPAIGMIIYQGNAEFITYDCERMYNAQRRQWAIESRTFQRLSELKDVLVQRYEEGISAKGIWLGCFDQQRDVYAVFWGDFYTSLQAARRDVEYFQRLYPSKELQIITLDAPLN